MPPAHTAAFEPDAPASTFEVRSSYLDQSVIGYLLYGVGAVTAFLAVVLSLSDAEAALHSSALAVGIALAGLAGERLDGLLGARTAHAGAYLLLAIASVCLAFAPAYSVTLLGALAAGLGTGLLLAHVNRTLTRGGGTLARVRMGRAALVAMVASLSVPLVIGLGENSGVGWQLAFVPAGVLILLGLGMTRGRRDATPEVTVLVGRLPGRYWLAWWLLVLVVSVEFSIVFWASTLVERQVGISLGDATLVATMFYAGMGTARVALSFHLVSGHDPLWLIRGSLAVALLGSLLAWSSSWHRAGRTRHLPRRSGHRVPLSAGCHGRARAGARHAGSRVGPAHPGIGRGHPGITPGAGRGRRHRRRLHRLAARPGTVPRGPCAQRPGQPRSTGLTDRPGGDRRQALRRSRAAAAASSAPRFDVWSSQREPEETHD